MMAAGWQLGAAPSGVLQRRELLGRDDDAQRLESWCLQRRVVSLLGAGGTGKTTLAAAVAPGVAQTTESTAWWVDLQRVPPDGDVAAAVGEVLGVDLDGASSPVQRLTGAVGRQSMLLVLDNCEHVVVTVAELLEALLPTCEGLRVLATSREPLGVTGEQPVRLEPLAVPAPDDDVSPAALHGHAGTELFLQRAGLDAGELDAAACRAVAGICRQLDGLPLAIELAAARSPTLSPVAIEAALEDRFRVLTSRRSTVAGRQRTLEASIEWSHDLLDATEQRLLRNLAVFPAGFDLATAAVVGADGDELVAMDLLTGLVDKSLVAIQDQASGRRYRLLESVQAFAEQQLREHEELAAARGRHLEATCERLDRLALSDDHEGLVLRGDPWMAEELDDVRAAASWAVETNRADAAVGLWWAVHVWAYANGRPAGPRMAVLAIEPDTLDARSRQRREVMAVFGPSVMAVGDETTGARLTEQLWVDGVPDPDRPLTAFLARVWLVGTRAFGLDADAVVLADAARELVAVVHAATGWGDLVQVTTALVAARALDLTSHHQEAYGVLSSALDTADHIGSPALVSYCQGMAATIAGKLTDPRATQHLERALDAMPAGWRHHRLGTLATAGLIVAAASGDVEPLRRLLDQHRGEAGAPGSGSWMHLHGLDAMIALVDGRNEDAMTLIEASLEQAAERSPMQRWRTRSLLPRALARVGRVAEARTVAEELHARFSDSPDRFVAASCAIDLSEVLLLDGDAAAALSTVADIVPDLVERHQLVLLPAAASLAARMLVALGRPQDATSTLRVAAAHVEARGIELLPEWQRHAEHAAGRARALLGDEVFEAMIATGQELSWEDWSAWLSRGGSRDDDRPPHGWQALTPTELDVARHAAQGLSTAEVAEVMFVSPNTIKTHLKHIYRKLDVNSRVELAGVVDEHDGGG